MCFSFHGGLPTRHPAPFARVGGHSAKCMELVIEGILEVLRIGEVALVVLVLGEYHLATVSPLDHVKRFISGKK
ncbi:hypothetical protein RLJV_24095 [Pseudomonas aeruginosa]|nr:hypothetical protein RLJV_24095 [Pseudomonas aeruginosa]